MKQFFLFLYMSFFLCCSTQQETQDVPSPILAWQKKTSLPQSSLRIGAKMVVLNDRALLLAGKGAGRFVFKNEWYQYSENNTWGNSILFPGQAMVGGSVVWEYDNELYFIGGRNNSGMPVDEVLIYNIESETFAPQEQFFKGYISSSSFGQSKTHGYVIFTSGNFLDNTNVNEMLSYDFKTKKYKSIDLPRSSVNGISGTRMEIINDNLYLLYANEDNNNFFKYNLTLNNWESAPDFLGTARVSPITASRENEFYIGFGINRLDSKIYKDLWKFDVLLNKWSQINEYPGQPFHSGFAFFLNNELYVGGGANKEIIEEGVLNDELYSIRLD